MMSSNSLRLKNLGDWPEAPTPARMAVRRCPAREAAGKAIGEAFGSGIKLFALGTNFYPFFLPQYIAAVACLFILASVEGLRILSRWPAGAGAARALIYLCVAQFVFSFGTYTQRNPVQRIEIDRQIAAWPGPRPARGRPGRRWSAS